MEHLQEPARVVKQIYRWLKPGGLIVCCVPNIRYWRIWTNLTLRGKWEYTQDGIMDQTHLRFFTTSSFRKMLVEAGFMIQCEDMRIAVGPKQRAFNKLTLGVFKEILGFHLNDWPQSLDTQRLNHWKGFSPVKHGQSK